ncbi:MAG TPA: ATP-binding cassette domain-containing protein [Gammaproteobacteria bacterium]|nr:ATP-binding cassette domain-containing protein [Gammaproteobacteria bacterium]
MAHVATGEPLIEVRGLVNRFGDELVHDRLDLAIRKGEILGLIGGSGSGKTVLVRSILGLNRPQAGRILYQGRDILNLPHRKRMRYQRHWGMLFQRGALFSGLTVLENVALPMREHLRLSRPVRQELAALKIHLAGLPMHAGERFPAELSGGMVKRAALARALALEPEVVFLDEPTAGLDPIAAASFDDLIQYLQEALKLTVVIVTHDLYTLVNVCHRLAVIMDRQVTTGTLEEMLEVDHPWSREYFHGPRMRALLEKGQAWNGTSAT